METSKGYEFPTEFTREVKISSIQELLNFSSPRDFAIAIVPTSANCCKVCMGKKGIYKIGANRRVGDVLSKDNLPPFHPNCKCVIKLLLDTGTYEINPSFPEPYIISVPRAPYEIKAMNEGEFWELKAELEKEFGSYREQLAYGPWDSVRHFATKFYRKLGYDFPELKAESCEARAEYLAKMFELIVNRKNLKDYVNITVVTRGEAHAWVEVEIKYLSDRGYGRTVIGKFDAWRKKDKGIEWVWN